ncbi:MAG: malonic semialdehyde reductase [Alphaproteobacteria bacterium]|nr:MAG: malonic semialdehyde reductase [Alphaproteobacteria bacterium]
MADRLSPEALNQLFLDARSFNRWEDRPVADETLEAMYDLLRMGATSANCCPARFVFVKSDEAKARLKPHLDAGNVEKSMTAPVVAIIGHDLAFADKLPFLFPHNQDAKNWFANPAKAELTAFRNGTLQGAYMMLAARAVGLDCGPMSGFNNAGVDAEFFAGTAIKSNFICALGYGTQEHLHPRGPRLPFTEAASVL